LWQNFATLRARRRSAWVVRVVIVIVIDFNKNMMYFAINISTVFYESEVKFIVSRYPNKKLRT
jgi:hypothetical protein